MRHVHRCWPVLLAVLAGGPEFGAGQSSPPRRASRPDFREHYGIVYEQNIFLRERRRSRREPEERRPEPPRRREEEMFALRGVVFEDGAYRAFFENLSSSTMLRLSVGDKVARGTISQIELDAVEYEQGGVYVWVEVGKNLTGATAVAALPPASQPGGASEGGEAAALPIDPNDPNLTIEQKMKLRRQQQLGGGR